jgi:hypothetical protein
VPIHPKRGLLRLSVEGFFKAKGAHSLDGFPKRGLLRVF